jgi:hypothetical protein
MFTLKTPIDTPYNQTGLVSLESLSIRAPGLFTKNILNDPTNAVTISTYTGVTEPTLYHGVPTPLPTGVTLPPSITSGLEGTEETKSSTGSTTIHGAESFKTKGRVGISSYDSGYNLYFNGVVVPYGVNDPDLFSTRDTAVSGLTNQYPLSNTVNQKPRLLPNPKTQTPNPKPHTPFYLNKNLSLSRFLKPNIYCFKNLIKVLINIYFSTKK